MEIDAVVTGSCWLVGCSVRGTKWKFIYSVICMVNGGERRSPAKLALTGRLINRGQTKFSIYECQYWDLARSEIYVGDICGGWSVLCCFCRSR